MVMERPRLSHSGTTDIPAGHGNPSGHGSSRSYDIPAGTEAALRRGHASGHSGAMAAIKGIRQVMAVAFRRSRTFRRHHGLARGTHQKPKHRFSEACAVTPQSALARIRQGNALCAFYAAVSEGTAVCRIGIRCRIGPSPFRTGEDCTASRGRCSKRRAAQPWKPFFAQQAKKHFRQCFPATMIRRMLQQWPNSAGTLQSLHAFYLRL